MKKSYENIFLSYRWLIDTEWLITNSDSFRQIQIPHLSSRKIK